MAKKKKSKLKKINIDKEKVIKTTKKAGRILWVVLGILLVIAFIIALFSFMKILTGDIKNFFDSIFSIFDKL